MKVSVSQYKIPQKCYGISRDDLVIKGATIHYISAVNIDPRKMFDMQTVIGILEQYGFSYHFLIDREGRIYQLVPLKYQAYHAGESKFKKLKGDCNRHSIGVALLGGSASQVGDDNKLFPIHQYGSCAAILNTVWRQSPDYMKDYLVGHEHIATPKGRRKDPGPEFDWDFLNDVLDDKHGRLELYEEQLLW